jgi:hypothetical protein
MSEGWGSEWGSATTLNTEPQFQSSHNLDPGFLDNPHELKIPMSVGTFQSEEHRKIISGNECWVII